MSELEILQDEVEKLKSKVAKLTAENYDLRMKLAVYAQNESRRYQYEQDYLPYAEDERD